MPASLSHSIGFCCASFHAVPEQVLAFQRPPKKIFVRVLMHFLRSQMLTCLGQDGWPTVILINVVPCCRLKMQVQEMLQRSGPAVKQVHRNLGCGCRTRYVLPLSGINYSCLFVLLQWAFLHAQAERWRYKGKFEGVLGQE